MQTAKALFHVAHPPDWKGPCSEFPNRPDQAAINDATPPFDSAAYPAGGAVFSYRIRRRRSTPVRGRAASAAICPVAEPESGPTWNSA